MYLSNGHLLFMFMKNSFYNLKRQQLTGATITASNEVEVTAQTCSSLDLIQLVNSNVVVGCSNSDGFIYITIYSQLLV